MTEYDKKESESHIERQNKEIRAGEIKFKQDSRVKFLRSLVTFSGLFLVLLLSTIITATIVSKQIYQDALKVDTEGNILQIIRMNIQNFSRDFYDRQFIRDNYDTVSKSLVGVSQNPLAFDALRYDELYNGVVMNSEGHILVPLAAVQGSTGTVFVRTAQDPVVNQVATVIGQDETTKMALIRIEGLEAPPVRFGDSSTMRIGQSVIAMGNSLGDPLKGTITFGVVSTVNKLLTTRTVDGKEIRIYVLETDAVVRQALDGGVLVNPSGEVVGINSHALTHEINDEFGTALSINEARHIARVMMDPAEMTVPTMGVTGGILNEDEGDQPGYYVRGVSPEGTADRAGLRPTDIILSIDGTLLEAENTMEDYLATKVIGDVVQVIILRGGQEVTLEATLYGAPFN